MFNLNAFIHGLNIFNLTKGPTVDDSITPDFITPTQIANGRLDAINRNANNDFFDEQAKRIEIARKEVREAKAVASYLASDRMALHRTISFFEKRIREGATVDQAFQEAEKFRATEYDNIRKDPVQQNRFVNGVEAMKPDEAGCRAVLVGGLPLKKHSRR